MKATQYNDTHAQALAYAEADRSDPFTYSRIMSHIANGICDDKDRGEDSRYKAELLPETELDSEPGRLPGPSWKLVGTCKGVGFEFSAVRSGK